MMSRRSAGLLMVALIFTAAPAAAQTITWQMANEYPATSIHGEGDQFFARDLSERSSGPIATATLRAAGALPSQLSFADALPKIKSGAIDAVLSSGDGGAGQRLWENLRYFTAINYSMTMSMVTINLDVWNGLDTDLRLAVQGAARATSERQWKEIQTRIAYNYERMRANRVGIITEVTPGFTRALREAGQIAIDDWLIKVGPRGQEILDTYRKQISAR